MFFTLLYARFKCVDTDPDANQLYILGRYGWWVGKLFEETESFICAIIDEVIRTNNDE